MQAKNFKNVKIAKFDRLFPRVFYCLNMILEKKTSNKNDFQYHYFSLFLVNNYTIFFFVTFIHTRLYMVTSVEK